MNLLKKIYRKYIFMCEYYYSLLAASSSSSTFTALIEHDLLSSFTIIILIIKVNEFFTIINQFNNRSEDIKSFFSTLFFRYSEKVYIIICRGLRMCVCVCVYFFQQEFLCRLVYFF